MNSLSIEAPNSQTSIVFIRHPGFEREIKKFSKRVKTFDQALISLEKLLGHQFHLTNPRAVITTKNLHKVHVSAEYELWKVNCVATRGLRRSQMPRIYFARRASEIFFLCLDSHTRNYDDGELRGVAFQRLQTYFDTNSD